MGYFVNISKLITSLLLSNDFCLPHLLMSVMAHIQGTKRGNEKDICHILQIIQSDGVRRGCEHSCVVSKRKRALRTTHFVHTACRVTCKSLVLSYSLSCTFTQAIGRGGFSSCISRAISQASIQFLIWLLW